MRVGSKLPLLSATAITSIRLLIALCLVMCTFEASAEGDGIFEAIRSGDTKKVSALLKSGVDIEMRDDAGRTPLLVAVHEDARDIARLLIGTGANVDAKDTIKDTPFLYAAAEGRAEILKLILEAGPNLKDTNRFGGTGLIPASHHGHPEVVRLLLATDIDVDHVNKLGWTALIEAVILGDGGPTYQEIVKLLVDAGARRDIADRDGVTPLEHAKRLGFTEIAALLE